MSEDMIVQLNIPFMVRPCSFSARPYCSYDPKVLHAYARAVMREIEALAPDMEDSCVSAVSIEGGTPALMAPEDLSEILRCLKKHFPCSEDLQIALQTIPGNYSRALMDKMRDAGVNFWNFSLLTPQLGEYTLIDPPYKFDAITMVDMAVRAFHPKDLSFELLYGIPPQTEGSWKHTLERVLAYEPAHMTIRPLRAEPGSLLQKRFDNPSDSVSPCPNELYAQFYHYAADLLSQRGYVRYSSCDFALPGHENRFTLGQLSGTDQLGVGYMACSYLGSTFYTNGHSLQEYIDHSDEFPVIANNVRSLRDCEMATLKKTREAMKKEPLF